MKQKPLVSVVVTTRNNTGTLSACLQSIQDQTYDNIELVVVDNHSSDDTVDIAKCFTSKVYVLGPERSAQRNFAVSKAKGEYVCIIDSDMELSAEVVSACVKQVQKYPKAQALVIPEESFGEGYWANCKSFERSFYIGISWVEAARFFATKLYRQVGGYNQALTGGEDWDLTRRMREATQIGRVKPYIYHNEGRLYFMRTVRKMYYYASNAVAYFNANPDQSVLTDKSGPLARYKLFFSHPGRLLHHPLLAIGMLTLKTAEFGAGGVGYLRAKRRSTEEATNQ